MNVRISYLMKYLSILGLLVLLPIQSMTVYAQGSPDGVGTPNLFSYSRAMLTSVQSKRLDTMEADPTAAEVKVVDLDLGNLRSFDRVKLNILGDQAVPLEVVRVDERSPSDYSWVAEGTKAGEDAILVVQDNQAYGTIHSGGKLYRLRPLDGGSHALIRVDETKFPPEHPPEFEQMEKDVQPQSRAISPQTDELGDSCSQYKAIIAYTPGAKSQAGNIGALIQLAIDETNQGYVNSGITTRIKLAHTYQTNYTESSKMITDRDRFRIKNDGFMDEVHSLRNKYKADVAILITKSGDYCGIAAGIGASEDTAFAVVGQNCATGYYSFAHEIGHLQGARHNPEADSNNTPYSFGHGYFYKPGKWRTVMSYNCSGGCTRMKYWSNPNKQYQGKVMGTVAKNDNHRVLNTTACKVANFRKEIVVSKSKLLAFGVILANGKRSSGTNNWSSSYNNAQKRYEIRINGANYHYLKYTTLITPAGDVRFCRSNSVGGKLLIHCHDTNGNPASSRLGFVTYKN
jgi:hypothetical protein